MINLRNFADSTVKITMGHIDSICFGTGKGLRKLQKHLLNSFEDQTNDLFQLNEKPFVVIVLSSYVGIVTMAVVKGFTARTIGIVKLIVAIVYIVGRVMGFVE